MTRRVVLALCVAAAVFSPPAGASAEPVFPPGFGVTSRDTGQGIYNLTDFAFLPSGSMLTTGKNGLMTRVDRNGAVTTVAKLAVASDKDLGLLGLSLSPDYAQTGHVYVVYSVPLAPRLWSGRLSRFTVDNPSAPTALGAETIVVGGIEMRDAMHGVGTVIAAPDGTIWFGMGDSNYDLIRAQQIDSPTGKIMRVNANGTGVNSNPFYDPSAPSSWQSRVWAYGLRNPFRFTLHSDGTPYIGDVGEGTREEVDLGMRGSNYGWPCYEGTLVRTVYQTHPTCQALYATGTATMPLWEYHRAGGGMSVTGGEFAGGEAYPEPYANSWFFGEFVERKVFTMETDVNHAITRYPEAHADRVNGAFGKDVGNPVAFRRSALGEIHYADIDTGQVVRVHYTGGNRAPTVRASADTTYNNPTVKFFASSSSDPDGDALTYDWDFGDGSAHSNLPDPTHTYPSASRFTATVTVTDGKGGTASKPIPVVLDDQEPTLLVTEPPQDKRFAAGELITATAAAADKEDADLDPEDVQWRADLLHCNTPTSCHTHPGRVSSGPQFEMAFPDHGPDVSVVVNATVQDSVGHVETHSFEAKPRLHTLTMMSEAGAPMYVNGEPVPPTGKLTLVANSQNTLRALDGHNTSFFNWSDGNTESTRPFTMPFADTTVTAHFRDVSLSLSFSGGRPGGPPLVAHVKANGLPGDVFTAPAATGCNTGPATSGDNGDGQLAYGETWAMPCYLTPPMTLPAHTVTMSSITKNGGTVTGSGSVPIGIGYRMVATDGGIFSFGEAPFWGSMGGTPLNSPVISMAATPTGSGYWMVASDGGIFSFGDAVFHGSKGGQPLPAPVVAMAPTQSGGGYWLVTSNGRVYPFGNAVSYGSLEGVRLAAPIVGMAASQGGAGYYLVAADGGVFTFGDARFFGSMGGQRLNQPIVGITPTSTGKGYWQVALDGGVFSFGDALFHGSMGGTPLNAPITGMTLAPSGDGYWQVATDGGIFAFGDAPFFGSMGGTRLNEPVVGITPATVIKAG